MGGIVASKPTLNLGDQPCFVDKSKFSELLFGNYDKVLELCNKKLEEIEIFEKIVENYSQYYFSVLNIHSFQNKLRYVGRNS